MDENKISNKLNILNQIYSTIEKRRNNENDENSYVSSLFNDGLEKIHSKIAEEAAFIALKAGRQVCSPNR